jgi:enamine deaminase RidA (YjgF/YER057c/UK114 family)
METTTHTTVNPWTWQDAFAFSQAVVVPAGERTVLLAGQGPVDADGAVLHAGDMAGQIGVAMDNVETVLAATGMSLADVVRMTLYTTDIDRFFEAYGAYAGRLAEAGVQPPASLIGVARLALPGMDVEIEATASR